MPEGTNVAMLEDAPVGNGTENIKPTGNVTETAIKTLVSQEGFGSEPYDDMGSGPVGWLQIAASRADERALIKDINNVTQAEADAVLRLNTESRNMVDRRS